MPSPAQKDPKTQRKQKPSVISVISAISASSALKTQPAYDNANMDIALITYAELPDLTEDDRLLQRELEARGLSVAPMVWDDPDVDWAKPTLCVLRETWDYHLRLDEFLAWIDHIESRTTLLNSPSLVRWNAHKGYLRDLEAQGIPIVPTSGWRQARGSTSAPS